MSMDRLVQRVRRSGSLRRKPSPMLSDATRSGVIDGDFIVIDVMRLRECSVRGVRCEVREAARSCVMVARASAMRCEARKLIGLGLKPLLWSLLVHVLCRRQSFRDPMHRWSSYSGSTARRGSKPVLHKRQPLLNLLRWTMECEMDDEGAETKAETAARPSSPRLRHRHCCSPAQRTGSSRPGVMQPRRRAAATPSWPA